MSVVYHGERFAGYRLVELIGGTALTTVYRAVDAEGRTVAVRILEGGADEPARQRILHGPAMVRELDHPHILPIIEAGEAEGHLFVATRYVRGGDLAGILAGDGGLEPDRAVALLTEIASALDAAHAHGLSHGGLTPANILVETVDGVEHAHLGDLGTSVTRLLQYLAPEQLEGGEVDARADVYALGRILRQCLEPAGLSEGLTEILGRALTRRRDDRYPTATAFLAEVRRAISDPGYRDHEAAALRSRHTRPRPPGPWAAMVAAAAAATLLAAGAGLAVRVEGGGHPVTPSPASATALMPPMPTGLLAPDRSDVESRPPATLGTSPHTGAGPTATPAPRVVVTLPLPTPAIAPIPTPALPIAPPLSGAGLFYATVRNTGTTELLAGPGILSNPATAAIVNDGCAGTHIAPGGSCLVTVRVQPSAMPGGTAVLSVPVAGAKPVTFTLQLSGRP